jgi:DNA-binding PadR family transcriptional regulator
MTTLGHVLLGLLARKPASGYDLAQTLKGPVDFFWQARHSQIYPELARLDQLGYVEVQHVPQTERPDKKIYSITETGQAALEEWVTAPVDVPVIRDELVLKAYCLWLADPTQAVALFHTHEQHHAAILARYQRNQVWLIEQWETEGRRIESPWFGSVAAIQRGIGYEQEYVAWCRWMISQLEHTGELGVTG